MLAPDTPPKGAIRVKTTNPERSKSAQTAQKKTPKKTTMAKYKLEYLWLDGYTPVANLRGKTQIKEFSSFPKLEELPLWGFDGSSTRQAEGHNSDCILKPVSVFPDTTRKNGVLV